MNELYDRCNDWAFLQQRTKLELFRQNRRTNFFMTNFCFVCCIRIKNLKAVKFGQRLISS